MLTPRQEKILRIVVEVHTESGMPVGSRVIADSDDVSWAASTVRNEFAVLVSHGLLEQPHTSAGRRPTERGYRYFVDGLIRAGVSDQGSPRLDLAFSKNQVEEAIRETTETLAEENELLALISAPPLSSQEIVRVELIRLQPHKVAAVVITSSGGVNKRVFEFDSELDSGLAEWATGYLNERLKGLPLGARMIRQRLLSSDLSPVEHGFIEAIASVFLEPPPGEDTLFVGGTGNLVASGRRDSIPGLEGFLLALEERAGLSRLLRAQLGQRGVYLRIGHENEARALAGVSMIGANYGTHTRSLGSVNVIGPIRMDYPRAISSVRYAAARLSEFVADVYA